MLGIHLLGGEGDRDRRLPWSSSYRAQRQRRWTMDDDDDDDGGARWR